tara:strand:+ start:2323 stop:2700 length:378 start_codon:yes stop_codon:yes gene_type:complete
MNKAIRNQRLGEAIASGIENGGIEDMLFIFDDDGFVTDTDKMAWNYNKDQDTWTDEQGNTMQERWANGIYNDMVEIYKFKGDIKIFGFINPMSGIDEISTVSMKTEKPDTPDIDTIKEVNNPEQG